MALHSLRDLFELTLADLDDVERRLADALPQLAAAATTDEVRKAFEEHAQQTRGHLERIEDLLPTLGIDITGTRVSAPIVAMIDEAAAIIDVDGDPLTKDAALIALAQKAEHYEIASYGTAAQLADDLDLDEAKEVLGQTLDEEEAADKLLTKIATGGLFRTGVNERAAR
ncbi:MAG: DUF892 family protein [Gaiellaceae bacterium]